MKKIISLFLSLIMLLSITAGIDLSAYAATSGDWKYTVQSDGTAKIYEYTGSSSNVSIPTKIAGYKVTALKLSAFDGLEKNTKITIPKTITSIKNDVYGNYFTSITVDSSNTKYSSKDGVLFNKKKTKLIKYPSNKSGSSYTIPSTVTTIGDSAFYHVSALKKVTIPSSVKTIGVSAFYEDNLREIKIPNSVTSIGDSAFVYALDSSYSSASITIGTGLKKIAAWTFFGCYPSSIIVPDNVTSIDEYAFGGFGEYDVKLTILNPKCKFTDEFSIYTNTTNIVIYGYKGSTAQTYANKYSKTFKEASRVTLMQTSFVYDGNTKKPTVVVKNTSGKTLTKGKDYTITFASSSKNVGKYTVKVKFKGNYSGTVTKTYTIKPKSTTVKSLTAKSNGLTVKWSKKTAQVTGYEIQYSKSSSFSSGKTKTVTVKKNTTTSKTISGLKSNTKYYVRIRTYKTVKVNGKSTKYYSSWSNAKKVTTK
ncbi:MAG: fibronectin type III domain-containing protein [Clostridiales bacterium]|nr:fibronectin type III domain-containing protein [Clostridiales bacterium]